MDRRRAYRVLCSLSGGLLGLLGLTLFAGFFAYHAPNSEPALPTGPIGHYFAAFAGCALVGWGGALLAAAREPGAAARAVGTATALALVLAAVTRIAAWFVGDYHAFAGDVLRFEAAGLLVLALLFVWLRPPRTAVEARARVEAH